MTEEADCTFWHSHFNDCVNSYCYYETNPLKTCPKKQNRILDSAPNNTARLRNQLEQKANERKPTPSVGEFN